MWSKTYSKNVTGIRVEDIWSVWIDVGQWHKWHDDIEYAKLIGEFKVGNTFILKPKNGPKVTIELLKVEKNKCFIDLTRFPGARMYGIHELIISGDILEIKTTMRVEGIFSFIWRKLVAEKIANSEESQTNALIHRITEINNDK